MRLRPLLEASRDLAGLSAPSALAPSDPAGGDGVEGDSCVDRGDGGDGPRGRSRRTPSPPPAPVRVREAESIKVAAFPQPPAFRNWKSALRQEVAAASGRPGEAFKWFQATGSQSFERLADPG